MNGKTSIYLLLFFFIFLLGGIVVSFGFSAALKLNPKKVVWSEKEFIINIKDSNEARIFAVINDVDTFYLEGSTDRMCDLPYLMLLDMDSDDISDLYFHHCGGHGYVMYDSKLGKLIYIDLGQFNPSDALALQSFWTNEIKTNGLELKGIGLIFLVIGIFGIVMTPRFSKNIAMVKNEIHSI